MIRFWLITTAHLEDGIWFRDREDFKVAMNFIAIQAFASGVVVVAFILMSNHVHFILKGRKEDVGKFVNDFKHRYSIYYRKKYGIAEFLRRNGVDFKEVSPADEGLERAIAYVQMNCVAAGICSHPSQYPWGTGKIFFNLSRSNGRRVGELSGRELIRTLHSNRCNLPENWLMGEDGFILPECYTDVELAERTFRTPQRMNYFLNSSSKAKKRIQTVEGNLPAFRDQSILAALPDLCQSLFGKSKFEELAPLERGEMLRQLRYRFSAGVHQLARVCGLTYEDAARTLDSV